MIIGLTGRAGSGKDTVASMISNRIPGTDLFSFAAPIKEFVEVVFQIPRHWLTGPSEYREKVYYPAVCPVAGKEYWQGALARFWNVGGSFSREWLAACGLSPASKGVGSSFVDWFDHTRHAIEKDPCKATARYLCQQLGTEFGRNVIDRDVWMRVALDRISKSTAAVKVVTDVRFDNEAEGLLRFWKTATTPALSNTAEIWRVVRGSGNPAPGHASEKGIKDKLITRTFPNFGSLDALRADVHEALFLTGLTD